MPDLQCVPLAIDMELKDVVHLKRADAGGEFPRFPTLHAIRTVPTIELPGSMFVHGGDSNEEMRFLACALIDPDPPAKMTLPYTTRAEHR